jgi:ATP-binding cassette subfamily B protein
MDRETERVAFTKARTYLNYSSSAKWLAYVSAAGSGVVYLALLVVLWLFADLMVFRGRIPTFGQLTTPQQSRFLKWWDELPPEEKQKALAHLGLPDARAVQLLEDGPVPLELGEKEGLWQIHVRWMLNDRLGLAAVERVLPRYQDLTVSQKQAFQSEWAALPLATRQQYLSEAGFSREEATTLAARANQAITPAEWDRIWWDKVEYLLYSGPNQHNEDRRANLAQVPLSMAYADKDRGVLSLIVRLDANDRIITPIVAWVARWNAGWMWNAPSGEPTLFSRYLLGLFVIALLLALADLGLILSNREAAAQATTEAATRLRRAVYHHSFRLGTLAIRALGPSEAVTVFNRHVEAVHDALYTFLTVILKEPIRFTLLLLFAFVIQPMLALVFLLFAVLVWLVGGQLASYFRQRARRATHLTSSALTIMRESLMMMRLVKCYLMEKFNQARVERQLSRYADVQQIRLRGEAIYLPLLLGLGLICGLVLLLVSGAYVLSGRASVPSLVVLATVLLSLYPPIQNWREARRLIRRGRESAGQLFEFLERRGDVGQVVGAEFLPPLSQHIEFDNVNLRDPGSNRLLLEGVTFTIPAGQRIGLIGADDLEKYALVYLIPRLFDPTQGEIRIDQHNLRWVTLDSLRAQTAIVLTHNLVFHDTVANNIGCGDSAYTLPQIIEAAKMAHAHHFIQKLPEGYETPIGELGHPLTISEQFRIALARAILRDPALIIIEEPHAGLDEDTKSLLDDTLTRLLPGRTTIFLPHRISTLRNCDRLFLLQKGKIAASGTHRELLSHNTLYRHLHYIEFNEVADQV